MKRIILILLIVNTLIGCSKENNDPAPSTSFPVAENVQQYVGSWSFESPDCPNRKIEIIKGQELDQLIFDSISGTVKNKRLNASSPAATWIVIFSDSTSATVDYNDGTCKGTLTKL